ncbi:hypothetical protein CEUSTIGMA_g988.t1 [Chlamydomonas eustigma]|uniref:Uncharacterized protein n=1 Tax=Chlamydomonas eustigma TaxID=1157962 RepID=A0A250WRR2_9CHLO|nr:hypothetical protein CEUSTIGMA_g988.t1 [Chlamydomonas eustigma]|eukprot:GAX73537.1 hypothetical protein CEUSTIGMA_g988.t1 [Chlamydomonas eustigma]
MSLRCKSSCISNSFSSSHNRALVSIASRATAVSAEVKLSNETSPIKSQLISQRYADFPDVPNIPDATFLAADAIADLCRFISTKNSTLFAFPTLHDSAGYFSVGLAVGPASTSSPILSDTAPSPLRVRKNTLPDKLASAIIHSLQDPACKQAAVEAVGLASVHTTLLAVCRARQLLNVRHGKDCFCSIESGLAPWEKDVGGDVATGPAASSKMFRFSLHSRELPPPEVQVEDFIALDRQQQAEDARHDRSSSTRQHKAVASRRGSRGAGPGLSALVEVLEDMFSQRPAVHLQVKDPAEFLMALKALARLSTLAVEAKKAGYIAFASSPVDYGSTSSIKGNELRQGTGMIPDSNFASTGAPFPFTVAVQRLSAARLQTRAFGPARGKLTENSKLEGVRKAMAGELANTGYWSAQLSNPKVLTLLAAACQEVEQSLRYRGSRLGFLPEIVMVPRRAVQEGSTPVVDQGQGRVDADVDAVASCSRALASAGIREQYSSTLLVHFLECDSVVARQLLRSQLKVPHSYPVLQESRQLDLIHKMVTLKNKAFANVMGITTIRPYIDSSSTVRVEVKQDNQILRSKQQDAVTSGVAVEGQHQGHSKGVAVEGQHQGHSKGVAVEGQHQGPSKGVRVEGQHQGPSDKTHDGPQPSRATSSTSKAPAKEQLRDSDKGNASDNGSGLVRDIQGRLPGGDRWGGSEVSVNTLVVSGSSDPSMVARAIGWEVLSRTESMVSGRKKDKEVELLGHGKDVNSEVSKQSGQQVQHNGVLKQERMCVTLRMGFGESLVKGVTAIAMAQGRVAEQGEGQLVAFPQSSRVQEEGRTFNVAEWDLYMVE